ncbi:02e01e7b-0d29-4d77-9ef7-e80e921d13d0 [Thermothielavioides terrestris]|uniref:02e01e7b-0d29-4d77-9ef7-e80e921d13d0 n=1 Tax=Thermothielavioides terrestris TaxID=2587410 RepID=A0A446BV90_9PEZI|nr:02e01e7b-0d29-4d77-9ef7-e80e921d13d0 [Thermothielavioides terrestris]
MNNMAGMPTMNAMNAMGGPAGPTMTMMNNGPLVPQQQQQQQPPPPNQIQVNDRTLLNTYIYDYFIRNNMFDCARAVYGADPHIKVIKDSPGKHRDENGNVLGNGVGDATDADNKDALDQKRPDDLPAPNLPTPVPDSCFLYDWFCLFWDMFNSQKGKGSSGQAQSRLRQEQQRDMLRQMRPEFAQQQFHQQMMRSMPNSAMNIGMKPGNQLQRTAMANSQNPQAMQMLHQQQKAAGQMQRDPSDMDGNRARPASPGGADNAPSPSKRPRLDGGAPFNPNQGVMMPGGRPGQGMPGQQQLQAFASAAPHVQAKTLATYSTNMSQHHGNQMPNKPMPNAAGPQGQGSPMVPQGPDGSSLTQYYNPGDMAPGNMRANAPNGQATTGSNHALQDYQMQLMLLEQQNKKRLMMARQEQDHSTTTPRGEGPGGPGAAAGPNGQPFQGTSPPGGRSGASPNPSDQMKRPNPQMANAANMGSPLPDGTAQSRSSPGSMNFMGANMDPSAVQHFGMNMNMATQMNGAMRPPPPYNGQMNPQQMLAAQRQAQQAGAQGAPMQWPQGGPNGQMAGQPPQPQMQGGPAQNQRSMPPPSAPATAAANAANARNPTASPQVSNAAPPTPSQGNKPAPKKKETKSAKAKAAAQKKSNPNLNQAGATPAAEAPEANQEAPTPATPITPANPAGFGKNQGVNAGQVVPNGQPAAGAPMPQAAPAVAAPPPPHTDSNQATNFLDTGGMDFPLEFTNPMQTDNVIEFDFDTFLTDDHAGEDGTFDLGFSMETDTSIGATE